MSTYLIVANRTLTSPALAAAVEERVARGGCRFHVIVPATPVQHRLTWTEEETTAAAQRRLESLLGHIRSLGVEATGAIGCPDPVAAVEDALRERQVDEVILSTLPPGISRWLRLDLANRLRSSISVPVVVVTATADAFPERGRVA